MAAFVNLQISQRLLGMAKVPWDKKLCMKRPCNQHHMDGMQILRLGYRTASAFKRRVLGEQCYGKSEQQQNFPISAIIQPEYPFLRKQLIGYTKKLSSDNYSLPYSPSYTNFLVSSSVFINNSKYPFQYKNWLQWSYELFVHVNVLQWTRKLVKKYLIIKSLLSK